MTSPEGPPPKGHRACTKCKRVLPFSSFHKHKNRPGGRATACKDCAGQRSRKNYRTYSKERVLWLWARNRARVKGREFSIEVSDIVIPDICPVLGLPMVQPSIDRVDSALGYVKGNIRVISLRANMLKNNATEEEIEAILRDLKLRR